MAEVKIRTVDTVHVSINSKDKAKVGIGSSIVEVNPYEFYKGDYTFTSNVKDQVINTQEQILLDNIVILKIPTYEVPNDAGVGLYIGGE